VQQLLDEAVPDGMRPSQARSQRVGFRFERSDMSWFPLKIRLSGIAARGSQGDCRPVREIGESELGRLMSLPQERKMIAPC